MPALQVKDFPADLYESLRVCAAAQDRSISQQTVHVLREYLRASQQGGDEVGWATFPVVERTGNLANAKGRVEGATEDRIERRRKAFERIHAMPKIDMPDGFPAPADLIGQMREERDGQIVPGLGSVR